MQRDYDYQQHLLWTLIVLFSTGCGADLKLEQSDVSNAEVQKEAWDYVNRPEAFELPLTLQIDSLPLQGEVDVIPWTETYWPSMDDSMNARWLNARTLSPLEKYDVAFNGWRPPEGFMALRPLTRENCASGQWDPEYYEQLGPAAKRWSDLKGNGRARNGIDDDGDGQIDECDDLDGIEGWWGSCHAWVPASLLEKEPLEAVEYNGVRFEVSDVKALLILLYDESRQIAVGERCIQDNPVRDAQGRIIDPDCRNTNAGTFHLLVTNMIGLLNRPLGEDRVNNRQVWNQPISGYRIEKQLEISRSEALTRLNLSPEQAYIYNEAATRFVEVRLALDYITESHPSTEAMASTIRDYIRTDVYQYILELNDMGDIIGGEWLPSGLASTNVNEDRPDYLWIALGPGRTPIPEIDALNVRQLHRSSRPETRSQGVTTFRKGVNELIRDWPWEGVTSTIRVDEPIMPTKIVVGYSILHDFIYDLSVRLVRNGEEILLFDRKPKGSLTAIVDRHEINEFLGASAEGEWRLVATDHNGRAVGRFLDWHIELYEQ
ncbi:MAG: proprotein convertase P-domain-containing protein [Bradymonadia bacterium]